MSLINHNHEYKIYLDNFFANAATISGVSYSKRHFELIKTSDNTTAAIHIALGFFELLPIIGAIVAIFERVIATLWRAKHPNILPDPKQNANSEENPHLEQSLIPVQGTNQNSVLEPSPIDPRLARRVKALLHPDQYPQNRNLLRQLGVPTQEQAIALYYQFNNRQAGESNSISSNQPLLQLTAPQSIPPREQSDKGKEEIFGDDFVIMSSPTPSRLKLGFNHWGNLKKIGQIVLGNHEPIVTFLLENMPETIKTQFEKLIEKFSLFAHQMYDKQTDEDQIFHDFHQFHDKQNWSFIDQSDARKYQVLFWFYAAYLIDQNKKKQSNPTVLEQLQKMSALALRMAQKLLRETLDAPDEIAKVEVRKMGGISTQEHEWVQNRLSKVLKCQKTLFNDVHLTKPLKIGLCFSGGGFRATTLAAGYMTALHKLGIVDSSMYVSGLSGSTWFLVSWLLSGKNPEESKNMLRKIFPNANIPSLLNNMDGLDISRFIHDVILPKAVNGKPISSVDFYGGLLARALLKDNHGDRRHELTMKDIAKRIQEADCPFPIFTAISETNVGTMGKTWYNWYEFNAYEVENNTLGLSIPASAFGSKFDQGTAEILSEEKLNSLMAMWGSAYAINLSDPIDEKIVGTGWLSKIACFAANNVLPNGFFDGQRVSPTQAHNPWYNLPANLYNQRFIDEEQPKAVIEQEKCTFVDAGIQCNLPLIPLLKRMRDLDVVIVGDASAGDITKEHPMPGGITLCPEELSNFFNQVEAHGILYKRVDLKNLLNYSVYVPEKTLFEKHESKGLEGEKLPIIIYFNFNMDKEMIDRCKESGELGEIIREHKLDSFDAVNCLNGYGNTFNFEYSSEEFAQLAAVGEFNILSHADDIKLMLKLALERKQQLDELRSAELRSIVFGSLKNKD